MPDEKETERLREEQRRRAQREDELAQATDQPDEFLRCRRIDTIAALLGHRPARTRALLQRIDSVAARVRRTGAFGRIFNNGGG